METVNSDLECLEISWERVEEMAMDTGQVEKICCQMCRAAQEQLSTK